MGTICTYTLSFVSIIIHITGTLYYFGDNDREGWRELFNKYKFPPYEIPKLKPEISFGMAGSFIIYSFIFSFPLVVLLEIIAH